MKYMSIGLPSTKRMRRAEIYWAAAKVMADKCYKPGRFLFCRATLVPRVRGSMQVEVEEGQRSLAVNTDKSVSHYYFYFPFER